MNATIVVLLVCSVVALAAACCTPAQWEGDQSRIGGRAEGSHHEILQVYEEMSYDAINNRTAFLTIIREGNTDTKIKTIIRYDNSSSGKMYVLDYATDKCSVYDKKTPFRRICVPAEAKPVEKFFLGLSGALNATWYDISSEDMHDFLAVEELGNNVCVPVGESIYGSQGKVGFVGSVIFTNITPGIKNTTIFDIPEQCKKMEESSLPKLRNRFHYFTAIY